MPANRLATALGLLICLTGPAFACVSDPDARQMTAETEGSPAVFAIPDPPVVSQPTGLQLVVCPGDANEVSNLAVDAWMPAHQHGMNYTPDIRALGKGRYAITNIVYHMPGLWQLTVTLRSGAERASYTLDMPIQ